MMDNLYRDISRTEVMNLIATIGHEVTFMVEGHVGSGKSALIHDLQERFKDTHKAVYMDLTQMDVGDLAIPAVDHETRTSTFYPNESLGLHQQAPMIIMLDEFGKASPAVKNSVLPMLIDRRQGNTKFHPKTIVFATTNLGAENVGDLFKPHERNRMSFIQMRKPNAEEWIEWGISNGIAPEVLAWVHQNPTCFDSFEDIDDPEFNQYIFHPKSPRTSFVTHRSMEQASKIIQSDGVKNPAACTHALMGTIGAAAALDIMSYIQMGANLPSRKEIINNPDTAPMPDSPAALVMLCVQSARWVDGKTIASWLTYMERFRVKEAQSFWGSVMATNTDKLSELAKVEEFTQWAVDNRYLFT